MQSTIPGNRLNYEVSYGAIEMWIDPLSDTTLQLSNDCQMMITNTNDNRFLGSSSVVAQGEKSETDGLAQGDFKVVFDIWMWSPDAYALTTPSQGGLILDNFNFFGVQWQRY